ncbi:hypothetical protein ABW20_dc0110578 [Dactylellina cionopaga]|nr:hypothetical protein ABW20_dc0110578 [Dactylellina cionopaga]
MVSRTGILLLFIGVNFSTSIPLPVPPTGGIKYGSGPRTKLKLSKVGETVGELSSPLDNTARGSEADIPSIGDEKSGRGWINNVAGPPMDTFSSYRPADFEGQSLLKQSFRKENQRPDVNLATWLKTAYEDPLEHEETNSEEDAPGQIQYISEPDGNGGDTTARFMQSRETCTDLSRNYHAVQLRFDDTENGDESSSSYDDRDNNYQRDKYDPNKDTFLLDCPSSSPIRQTLQKLLRKPLYPKLTTSSRIHGSDSSREVLRKMQQNVQPIMERGSMMELQSTTRGINRLPNLPQKLRVANPKFLAQGMESMLSPSIISARPNSGVASLINYDSESNFQVDRDALASYLTGNLGEKKAQVPSLW